MRTEIFAERQIWTNRIAVHIGTRRGDGLLQVLRPGIAETIPEDGLRGEPAMSFTLDEAQRLMDELWNCGLRPSEGMGSAGSLAAVERHLKDMQSITKGLLRKQGVEL